MRHPLFLRLLKLFPWKGSLFQRTTVRYFYGSMRFSAILHAHQFASLVGENDRTQFSVYRRLFLMNCEWILLHFLEKKADYLLSVLVRVFFAASRCPIILRFYYLGVIITDWKSPKDTAHTELGYFLNRYFSYTHNIYTEREREREREISEKAEMKTSFISPKCLTLILISRSREFTTNWWFTLHDSECNFMSGLSMQGEK